MAFSLAVLVLGPDDRPGGIGGRGPLQHQVLHGGEVVPVLLGLHVDLAELPLAERIGAPALEAAGLLVLGHREVELHEDGALAHEVLLEADDAAQEVLVLLGRAEPEDGLDHGPVVPGAVEQDDLPAGGELGDVALEVPLRALLGGRRCRGPPPGSASFM
ncbi:MAG: hypothetical protein R2711_11580 [Acidimicrobiales bacterium]